LERENQGGCGGVPLFVGRFSRSDQRYCIKKRVEGGKGKRKTGRGTAKRLMGNKHLIPSESSIQGARKRTERKDQRNEAGGSNWRRGRKRAHALDKNLRRAEGRTAMATKKILRKELLAGDRTQFGEPTGEKCRREARPIKHSGKPAGEPQGGENREMRIEGGVEGLILGGPRRVLRLGFEGKKEGKDE